MFKQVSVGRVKVGRTLVIDVYLTCGKMLQIKLSVEPGKNNFIIHIYSLCFYINSER